MSEPSDMITVTAHVDVWRAVRRALRVSPEASPFYQALVLEVESALDAWLDEQFRQAE